jgi:thymidylate synthase complementing protein thyX
MKNNLPQFEIWNQEPGIDGIYRQVERAGRVCYKSEDHCTAESARPFVERMIKSDHTAMLEHATVYLLYRDGETASAEQGGDATVEAWQRYERNKFSKVSTVDGCHYVTTNLRVLAENQWLADLDHLTKPLAHHERRVTVHFTTQIATTREFNRHRANSMAEQSTRYCNYSKDKFGNEISINIPEWVRALSVEEPAQIDFLELAKKVTESQADDYENWLFANLAAERAYMNLIALGRKPQEARAILPLDTNTELIHTAFVSDWKHFFDLRAQGTTGAPHPDAKVLALPLYDEFCRLGLIEA